MKMKETAARSLPALAVSAAVFVVASLAAGAAVAQVPLASTTLSAPKSQDQPYDATITVADAGKPIDGRKAIAYHLVLNSKTCHSDVNGVVTFFSKTDDGGDDSSFLPNGYATKINMYKGEGAGGKTALVIDIESKHPRYVDITLTGAPVLPGSCIPKEGVGMEFYAPASSLKPVKP